MNDRFPVRGGRGATARQALHVRDEHVLGPDRVRGEELVRAAAVPLQRLRLAEVHDLHGPTGPRERGLRIWTFPTNLPHAHAWPAAPPLKKQGGASPPSGRSDGVADTPTEGLEEHDITIGRARELVEKYAVTWVNIVDASGRTLEGLETPFGVSPLAPAG